MITARLQLEAQITELQAALVGVKFARTAIESPAADAAAAVKCLSTPLVLPDDAVIEDDLIPEVGTAVIRLSFPRETRQAARDAGMEVYQPVYHSMPTLFSHRICIQVFHPHNSINWSTLTPFPS